MSRENLSDDHKKFLDAYFEYGGTITKAAEACGYTKSYGYNLARKLKEEILEEASYILALGAGRAARVLVDGVEEEKTTPLSQSRIACAKEILDRVGISKKDRIEISGTNGTPLFILPPKQGENE